nr:7381_t:CDS:1 [Entrophospora candida]CAG8540866.1 8882_t:CDS:1 [Entrophospora candida]
MTSRQDKYKLLDLELAYLAHNLKAKTSQIKKNNKKGIEKLQENIAKSMIEIDSILNDLQHGLSNEPLSPETKNCINDIKVFFQEIIIYNHRLYFKGKDSAEVYLRKFVNRFYKIVNDDLAVEEQN